MRARTLLLLLLLSWPGCTEPNPRYDPLYVPPCEVGALKCGDAPEHLMVCLNEGEDPTWQVQKVCWDGTICAGAWCGPDTVLACVLPTDCTGQGEVCTAVTDSDSSIGTYCIPSPVPAGRQPGQACSRNEECQSGWCFRRTCFMPCELSEQCPFEETCENLNVTVDHVQSTIRGCVIP
ncbi:hypothetical protein KJ975_01915 [Myxococcota bacterium]|nr:hypothetical protein [Myxococcota bacterium]